jgi:ribosomal protein RSM22 (predicted rRNA methylase)
MSTGFTRHEIDVLTRIRSRFLDGSNVGGGYWRDEEELSLYDTTFAERIGWKWDAVLRELASRGWAPRGERLLDFGCGTGVASRRLLEAYPQIKEVTVADVSNRAVDFATRRIRADFPGVGCAVRDASRPLAPGTLLLVSHVLNELSPAARDGLVALAAQAEDVIWVEAGSHADSRNLSAIRDLLKETFSIVAPCQHSKSCGMLAPQASQHWCHFFTSFPSHAAQDARWSQLGRDLGIDLRALPYSFLVLQKQPALTPEAARIIGTPEEKRGHFSVLACESCGVRELVAQKRDVPGFFKALRKRALVPRYNLQVQNGKIVAATPLENGPE